MSISIIVAMSENGVIGRDNDMPWHISDDLKRFKRLTMGHHMIMGRKTYESIGRLLPGRTTIILTRDESYQCEGALIAHDLDSAIEMAGDDSEIFIVGGGQIYQASIHLAEKIHVTRVHCTISDGDVSFPNVDWSEYDQEKSAVHTADSKNDHDFTFITYLRKSK